MRLIICFLAILLALRASAAEPSKAEKYFMQHGLAVNAMCAWDQSMHLDTLKSCGFTGILWPFKSNMKQMGPPPGMPWLKWTGSETEYDVTPEEKPYEPSLFALQCRDEQDLNQPANVEKARQWFEKERQLHPNLILYTNQYGGELTNENFGKYLQACKPDILSFDTYPIWFEGDSWRGYFGDLQRYRKFSLSAGIPFQSWMQTFNGENKYRNPSESELRLDIFGAWTFGAKMQSAFTYNAGSTSLFINPSHGHGDNEKGPGYFYLQRILHESRMLSPYLSKLRCMDTRWIVHKGGDYPWDVQAWNFDKSFLQLRGITTTSQSKLLSGQPGDVALGFFSPIVEKEGERWLMVTNALMDRTATADQAKQRITLNLVLDPGESVHKVNRINGKLQPANLKKTPQENRYLLDLDLPGGTGDLLQFSLNQ